MVVGVGKDGRTRLSLSTFLRNAVYTSGVASALKGRSSMWNKVAFLLDMDAKANIPNESVVGPSATTAEPQASSRR
jgi:hypothetical protein